MEIEMFKTIVLPLREKLLSVARRMLFDNDDAEDTVQETFIRIWQSRDKIISHPNIEGYVMQTLKNICLDKIKLRKFNVTIDGNILNAADGNPAKNLEVKNDAELIKNIIQQLPELQKKMISMRDIEEYELSEIAEITGSNITAVKMNISRARKKVRDTFIKIQSSKLITNE